MRGLTESWGDKVCVDDSGLGGTKYAWITWPFRGRRGEEALD